VAWQGAPNLDHSNAEVGCAGCFTAMHCALVINISYLQLRDVVTEQCRKHIISFAKSCAAVAAAQCCD
jgi:hypothetical protein